MYENACQLMAKQSVALEVLSYHATAQTEESNELAVSSPVSTLSLISSSVLSESYRELFLKKKCFVFVPIFHRIPSVQLPFFLWNSLLLLPFNDGPHLAFAQHLSYCLLPDKTVFRRSSLDNSWVCVSFFSSFNSSCFFLTAFWHPERCWAPAILLRLRRHADGWWRYAQGMHSHVHGSRPHQSLQSTVWGRNLIRRFFFYSVLFNGMPENSLMT